MNKYYRSAAWSFKFRIIFLSKYICDIWKDLSAKSKLSADETSLFLVAHGRNNSTSHLYEDLKKIKNWAAQWKIFFNLDTIKAQKDIFSRKIEMPFQPQLRFDNTYVNWASTEKHLDLILDTLLNFEQHFKTLSTKVSRTIGLICKLRVSPQGPFSELFYYFYPLDYGSIIYANSYNNLF